MKVYQSIAEVMTAFSKEGISKGRTNTQGATYKFRGIDDVLNALSGHLSKAGLVIIPRVLSRECVERVTKNGGAIFYTNVDMEFDLVSAEDGSKHTARVQGEAMDTSDKSTNKAMSAAYKYMAFQTFCIPTEGDNDADAHTPEVAPKQKAISSAQNKRHLETIERELIDCRTPNDVKRLLNSWADQAEQEGWSNDYWNEAKTKFARRKRELTEDTVGSIEDTFGSATTVDDRIRDKSGREVHNLEGA